MTEPDDQLSRDRAGSGANFAAPPQKAAVPDWYPELLDAVTDRVQTGRRQAVASGKPGTRQHLLGGGRGNPGASGSRGLGSSGHRPSFG